MQPRSPEWTPRVELCSAVSGEGLEAVVAFLLRQLPPAGALDGQADDLGRAGC